METELDSFLPHTEGLRPLPKGMSFSLTLKKGLAQTQIKTLFPFKELVVLTSTYLVCKKLNEYIIKWVNKLIS